MESTFTFIDRFLKPSILLYVRDDFLNRLNTSDISDYTVTIDVESLYNDIEHDDAWEQQDIIFLIEMKRTV